MKILVLGGTGSMGVPLVRHLSNTKENNVFVTTRSRRFSEINNVHYIRGNAHNLEFVKSLLKDEYDVIVDFMVYGEPEFKKH